MTYAQAGVDVVAPSDMMDGRVERDPRGARRAAAGATSRSWRTARSMPRRSTARFAKRPGRRRSFGDRRGYQMDPPNAREALREIALDVDEGADIVMVKPGLPYLDVVRAARDRFDVPIAVYNVSGEYAMLHAAIAQRLARRRARDRRAADVVRARRRRHRHHVFRQGVRATPWMSAATGHRPARRRRGTPLSRKARAADRRRADDRALLSQAARDGVADLRRRERDRSRPRSTLCSTRRA